MPRLLDVNPTGWYSYGWHETVPLDGLGNVWLSGINNARAGGSNGAGKSSLYRTVCRVLFDRDDIEQNTTKCVNRVWDNGAWGKVSFINDRDEKWRVIVTRSWKAAQGIPAKEVEREPSELQRNGKTYSGTDIYLEIWDPKSGVWLDRRPTPPAGQKMDVKYTKASVLQAFGMSFSQFLSVSYIAQARGLRLVEGGPKERMDIFSEFVDLAIWDHATAHSKTEKQLLQQKADQLQAIINGMGMSKDVITIPTPEECEALDRSIGTYEERCVALGQEADKLAKQLDTEESRLKAIASGIQAAQADLRHYEVSLAAHESSLRNLGPSYDAKVLEAQRQIQSQTGLSDSDIRMAQLRTKIDMKVGDLNAIMTDGGQCPTCHMVATREHLASERAVVGDEIERLEKELLLIQGEHDQRQRDLEQKIVDTVSLIRAQQAAEQRAIGIQVASVKAVIAETQARLQALRAEQAQLLDNPVKSRLEQVRTEYSITHGQLSGFKTRLDKIASDLEKVEEINTKIEAKKTELASVQTDIKYHNALERIFSRDIKAHKFEAVVRELNMLIKEWIDLLTSEAVKVTFSPFREKGDGEFASEIQILVKEGPKEDVDIIAYSGGEKQQIILAIICALWKLASSQGTGINVICLDEVFSMMDPGNRETAVLLLDRMRARGYSTMFVISHDDLIRDMVKTDAHWVVIKNPDHMTHIERK